MDQLSDDVVAFLSEGTRTGLFGYLASDGRPLVAPVWFVVDDGELAFNTGKDTAKGRALARDPRVVMCVDDPVRPTRLSKCRASHRSAKIRGRFSTSRLGPAAATWAPTALRNMARRNGVPGELVVRIKPTRVRKAFNLAE